MERRDFSGLMALAVNAKFNYPLFRDDSTGPHPHLALTEGFFRSPATES
jgi:hypothetical protein